jgi:hypothetical protein
VVTGQQSQPALRYGHVDALRQAAWNSRQLHKRAFPRCDISTIEDEGLVAEAREARQHMKEEVAGQQTGSGVVV